MYRKAWCTWRVVILLNKPIAFLTFLLPSPSSLLKLLIEATAGRAVRARVRNFLVQNKDKDYVKCIEYVTFNCLILTLAILLATGPVRQCVAQLHQLLQNNSDKKKKTKGFFYKLYIFGAQSQFCFLRSASFSSFIRRSFWFRYLKGTLIRIFQTDTPYGCAILIHTSNATWKLGCIPAALSGPVFPNRDDWLPSCSQRSLLLALQACEQSVIRLRFRVCRLDVLG